MGPAVIERTTLNARLRVQIKNDLVSRYRAGERLPSERQLARVHNVAPVTISRVLQELSNDGIVYRVPNSGTYLCEGVSAQSEQSSQHAAYTTDRQQRVLLSTVIIAPLRGEGAWATEWEQGLSHNIMSAAERQIQDAGGSTYILDYDEVGPPSYFDHLQSLVDGGANSLILLPRYSGLSEQIYRDLVALKSRVSRPMPIVVARLENKIKLFDSVSIDASEGAFRATRHLASLGHRRIGFIGPHTGRQPWVEDRIAGYRLACELEGIEVRDTDIVISHPDVDFSVDPTRPGYHCGQAAAANIIAGNAITAVFCANDNAAIGAIDAFSDAGLSVPGDVSVVGYDDTFYGRTKGLTTIHPPIASVGREAALLLIDRLNSDKPADMGRNILLEPNLIVRVTTRQPKA